MTKTESGADLTEYLSEKESQWRPLFTQGAVAGGLNNTVVEDQPPQCVHQFFEAQVGRTPDAVALIFEGQRLTYRELNERADKLARYLRRSGVETDALVAICVERSVEMVVGILGILKAGAAYVPLDPAYPTDRLAYMLDDCRSKVLLTKERLRTTLPAHDARVICLDTDWAEIEDELEQSPTISISADNLAYVIYTSGSTGKPKGAMNTHRAVCNRLLWMQDAYRLDASDRVLQKTPFSFDVSVWEFFWPLMTGAGLVVARPLGHHDNEYLADLIAAEHITTLHFVPSMLQVFLEEPELKERCATLRRVICSGEALPYELQKRFFKRLDAELHNLYGPTEAAVDVTFWQCERESGLRVVPIGRPIWNTQIHLLDERLRPIAEGEAGELHIGGICLARGYLNRASLTAERFIPHPFSVEPGARLYKTGDLARCLPDGAIEYVGRIDHQVKICGVRIELGEIEAAMVEHPSVREAVVLAREDAPGDKRLVAYLVTDDTAAPNSDLRAFLQEQLPHYMVPSAFVWMDRLPLTLNGKVDRRQLPAPASLPGDERLLAEPRTPLEELIAGAWCEVLGLKAVGVDDNFFELGGHSLLASMLISRLRRSLQAELSVPDIFDSPTVAKLAAQVESRRQAGSGQASSVPVRRQERGGAFRLSYAQQRLWFLHRLKPESAFYNLPLVMRLRGPLDIKALEDSLHLIAARHEVLRTRFVEIDGEPMQVIEEPSPSKITVVEVSGTEGSAREQEALKVVADAVRTPFDLTRSPLWRHVLVRFGVEEYVLALVMHHIIADGWSLDVLARELSALYAACAGGRESPLTELPVQYVDYTAWQRERQAQGTEEEQLSYWREQLAGSRSVLQLPTDRPRPPVESYRGATLYTTLPESLTEALKTLGRRESSTLFMTLLAAFNVLLYRYTGQTDINVGTPLAGRNLAEAENLLGFFVNTLVIRTDGIKSSQSFRDLLRRVREITLAAYAHQDVPFERLVEELRIERSLSHAPLFQVVFAFNNTSRQRLELPGLDAELLEIDTATAKFDLALMIEDAGAQLQLSVEYSTDLFDEASIKRMVGHFQTLLESIVEEPQQRISKLQLLSAAESDELLTQWNNTQRDFQRDACVHELFEAQVERTPDALAAVCGDGSLTYSELNGRANQLARHLRTLGVGQETLVAMCVERSLNMIVAALAVLKAGGAYVPFYPSDPQERLAFMLEETAAPILLTERRLLDYLPPTKAQVICLDTDEQAFAGESERNLACRAEVDNLAYVIYTSGSTGKPKGVELQHEGLVNLVRWHQESYGLDAQARASQVAGQSFDASVWEVWPYLTAGACLFIADDETVLSPAKLWRWLRDQRVTHCFLPTPLAEAMLPLAETTVRDEDSHSVALRYLFTGGDQLHRYPGRELPFRLVNHYGPTENTVVATSAPVESMPHADAAPPIGRPVANTQIYILDAELQPVPVGVPGELYIGGCGLARGYLNHPELTAERFIPNPFRHRESLKVQVNMSEAIKNTSELSTEERAALVMRLKREADTAPREAIPRHRESGPFPLSFAQQRLWFLNVLEPNSPYIIPANFHLKGRLNREALERTVNEIVRRHEALRTTFTAIGGQPVQMITPHLTLPMPVYDLGNLPEGERETEIKRHKLEMLRPFNLSQAPLVRASLLALGTDEHLLLLTMHHIVSDGWSIGVMINEMASLYESFQTDKQAVLPELSIQYRDFAIWQREWLSGEQLEQQLAYWRENLRDAPPSLELPTDRPRPLVQTYRGEMLEREIGKALTKELKELSRSEGVTLYMTLLAVFKTLLYRYTGQEDIIVGTPVANRNHVDVENLIGFFVNTLVLRTDLSGDPTFAQLLTRVRDVTLGAFTHQDLPFEKLVEELQPERDMSRTPLFQVMFSLQNAPLPSLQMGEVLMRLHDDETKKAAQFDLTFDLMERDEALLCALEYNTDLFDRETAERMLSHYLRLLEVIVADRQQRLNELPMLADDERHRLLIEWNDTKRDYPRDRCIHELFEAQATRLAGSVAIVLDGQQLTYAELNARANRLAHYLRRAGARPEARIGILLEPSFEMAVAILGVLKAGSAYVALDPLYPPERLHYTLKDAGASLLLSTQKLARSLPEHQARVVSLDAEGLRIAEEDAENPAPVTSAENLAYLVYTSGTTGQPKGILIQHRSLVNAIYAFITHHQVTESDRILQFASLSFDVAAEEFFAAWLSGARLVMRRGQTVSAPEEFVQFLEAEGVTLVNLPASFWAEWVTAVAERDCPVPRSLRRVIVGNEKTLPESLAKWQNAVGDRVTWNNAYGPSETTITASNYEARRGAERNGASAVSIGRPVMNAKMYVLDKEQRLVPVGVSGELCVGGAGLARGYHSQPAQTAERFAPNPYGTGGERLYRTGDFARYLPDGNIEFLGRVDEQVKVRGFRIELGEIEAALNQHVGVRETVVVARPDGHGGNRLIAYVVESAAQAATAGELRRHLKNTLPEYMIPSAFVTLEALPMMPNGKVDRRRLPEADAARPELDEVYEAPRSELERTIASVWQEVLRVENVGVHDNFFNLGGHSLLIVQVNSRLREVLQTDLSIIEMFKFPTVSALAEHLSDETPKPSAQPAGTSAQSRLEAMDRQRQLRQRQQQRRRQMGASNE
jgi:amino acid adenylation domain-containing protein